MNLTKGNLQKRREAARTVRREMRQHAEREKRQWRERGRGRTVAGPFTGSGDDCPAPATLVEIRPYPPAWALALAGAALLVVGYVLGATQWN